MSNPIDSIVRSASVSMGDGKKFNKPEKAEGTEGDNASAPVEDTLSLTEAAESLGKLSQSLASEPPFDQQRVNDIKQQLARGEYAINAEKVASKFIELEKMLAK